MRWTRPCPTWSDSAACQRWNRWCIQVAMLCAGCDGGQHTVDQRSAAGCCAGCLPCFEDGCSRHHLPAEKCGRRCSSTDAVSGQDGLAAILRRCAARRYRRYGRVCCCCCRLVSRCLRFYNLRFIGRGKKPLAHPSLLPLIFRRYRTERRPTRTRQMSAAALAPPRRPLVKASHAGVLQRSAAPQQRGQLVGPVRAAHQVRQAHVHLDAAVLGAGSPSRAGEGSGPARRGCTCERERSRVGCDRPTTSPKGARRARTARGELAKLRGRKRAPCAHARTHAEASHRAARRLPSGTRPADQPTAAGVPRTAGHTCS